MAYPERLSYANMRDLIEQKLQDSGNAIWTTAELDYYIEDGLRELSKFHQHTFRGEFTLESRRGTATSTSAGNLVDATNSQFTSADVGKWIFNSDDRTWAEVTGYTSTTTLALSKDIMASGEAYQMFNKGCSDSKEVNIVAPQVNQARAFDYLYIENIEFPILQDPPSYLARGQWKERDRHIIRLKTDSEPDNTKNADARKEVWITFALRHKISQLTTLLGKIDLVAGYSAGDISIHVDDLQTDGTLHKGQEFTIDGVRGTYIADYTRTIATAETDISFWPPLADAVADGVTVRFTDSTLPYKLESVFSDLVAGKGAMSKARTYINTIGPGANRYRNTYEWGKLKYEDAKAELEGMVGFEAPSVLLP